MPNHHLIFEGPELAGKSWLMSQVYNFLELKYNQSGYLLDGCHWFNCDVGVFGSRHGKPVIKQFLNIFEELKANNLLAEKFHLSDIINNRLHRNEEIDYRAEEKKLKALGFKIILITFSESASLLEKRISDRLKLYPHYKRILRTPAWYINQQHQFLEEIKKTSLPYLIVKTEKLPDDNLINEMLTWIKEI